ncbi:hypothetical protein G6011_02074 [Alternaria panax]|uniref:Uncharacterized protein n=1 Tax=Alternaria panax TaxID=48097 RepID=A0AAD4FEG5_9PLEO|nr:hypothetical protein G6011_02074 [Alternaria panax]
MSTIPIPTVASRFTTKISAPLPSELWHTSSTHTTSRWSVCESTAKPIFRLTVVLVTHRSSFPIYISSSAKPPPTTQNTSKFPSSFSIFPEVSISVGAVVVMRKDKKDLLLDHAHALVEYHKNHLSHKFFQPASENVFGTDVPADDLKRDKAYVMKEITKDKFKIYFAAWKAGQTDAVARQRICPYLV